MKIIRKIVTNENKRKSKEKKNPFPTHCDVMSHLPFDKSLLITRLDV